jgi:syntaxin-binding protein 5
MLRVDKALQSTHRHTFMHRNSSGTDPVSSLAWAISGIKSGESSFDFPFLGRHSENPIFVDATPRIRLVAVHASGHIQVYTLARGGDGAWSTPSASFEAEGVLAPLAHGTFVLDAHTGAPCRADKAHLTVALESKASKDTSEEGVRCLLLVVGARAVRCLSDFGDERIAKAELGSKAGGVVGAQVIDRNGDLLYNISPEHVSCSPTHFRVLRASGIYGQARGPRLLSPGAGLFAYTAIACCFIDVSASCIALPLLYQGIK